MEKRITTPLTLEKVKDLKAGDTVLISGTIYTSRDAGHKRLVDLLDKGESLPFDPKDQIIYYVGPTPTKPGHAFGSAGPGKASLNAAINPEKTNYLFFISNDDGTHTFTDSDEEFMRLKEIRDNKNKK